MLERMDEIISRECGLTKCDPLIVGVSGGMDSLSLLDILHRLGYFVIAAHFNHEIRHDSLRDADLVTDFTGSRNIPSIIEKGSVPIFSKVQSLSIEEAARILRYQFLFRQAKLNNAKAVIVAHNANDQVETLIMNLLRGAGLKGMKGMTIKLVPNEWSRTVSLVRPFLTIWRKSIVAYCKDQSIESILDSTNDDVKFLRNRVRLELIPIMETYIPGVKNRLLQTSELLQNDHDYLGKTSQEVWNDLPINVGEGYVVFSRSQFNAQHLSIQRRLIQKSVGFLKHNERDIDYALVKRVLEFCGKPSKSFQTDIGLGLSVFLENELIYISSGLESLPHRSFPRIEETIEISIPGRSKLSNGWILIAEINSEVDEAKMDSINNKDVFQAWFDIKDAGSHLTLKCREPGDRFAPMGMDGKRIKISDLMINLKIPKRTRDQWPLVCLGENIVWVPGYRIANSVKIDKSTNIVVRLQLMINELDGNQILE